MRTVTEFPGVVLRHALKSKNELAAAGTAEDQLAAGVGTAFKVEGDRLNHLMKALTLVAEKIDAIARVRVFQAAEEQEATLPKGCIKDGEFHYLVEYIAMPVKAESRDRDSKGRGRGGRDGKGRGGDKGGRGGKGRGGDRDRADRDSGSASASPTGRGDRRPRAEAGAGGPPPAIPKPRDKAGAAPAGPEAAAAPSTGEQGS